MIENLVRTQVSHSFLDIVPPHGKSLPTIRLSVGKYSTVEAVDDLLYVLLDLALLENILGSIFRPIHLVQGIFLGLSGISRVVKHLFYGLVSQFPSEFVAVLFRI